MRPRLLSLTGRLTPFGQSGIRGPRVDALARPSEVLASQAIKDLTAGSGLTFEDAGEREVKGAPDRWRLYSVTSLES